MIKPPISELLGHVDCRYTLVVMVSRRARLLVSGQEQPLYDAKDTKPVSTAIEEVNRGLIAYTRNEESEVADA